MTMQIDFGDFEITVETKKVICPECQGHGTHLHPAFRNVAVETDLLRDREFMGSYFNGGMDVTCTKCLGANVVDSPIIPDKYKEAYDKLLDEEERFQNQVEWEKRMGA